MRRRVIRVAGSERIAIELSTGDAARILALCEEADIPHERMVEVVDALVRRAVDHVAGELEQKARVTRMAMPGPSGRFSDRALRLRAALEMTE